MPDEPEKLTKAPEVPPELVLFQIGFASEGGLAISWNDNLIQQIRKSYTPEQHQKFVQAVEITTKHLIRALCGGKQ